MGRAITRWILAATLTACGSSEPSPPQAQTEPASRPPAAPTVPVSPGPLSAPLPVGDAELTFTVGLDAAAQHLVTVEATWAPEGGLPDEVTLWMPTWTPGSYLIREYTRHLEGLVAVAPDGTPTVPTKVSKNRWVVQPPAGADTLTWRYTLYAREMTVRTNFVDADLALINGASTFVMPEGLGDGALDVRMDGVPAAWGDVATGLDAHPEADPAARRWWYRARSHDELVDSPIVAGTMDRSTFPISGVPHELVDLGGAPQWDHPKAVEAVKTLSEAHVAFWGEIPYDHYVFLNAITESGGGLEHLDSTLMLTSRFSTDDDARFERWLGLVSHEFFHTWNVKRLRPEGLGPFDYEHEVYTPNLWVAEGLTSYYGPLLLHRAGLVDEESYLSGLSGAVKGMEVRPGQTVRSLARSSFDAWIKHYRPDENSRNTAVSYYRKGSVAGWVLDARIRVASGDRASLDDVLRAMWGRFGAKGEPYTAADVRAVASEVAGGDLSDWFEQVIDAPTALDVTPALQAFGLRRAPAPEADDEDVDGPAPWLGITARDGAVTEVLRGTPAFQAGVNVGDEVLALDGLRWEGDDGLALHTLAPGDTVDLLVSRRGRLRTLSITAAVEPHHGAIEIDPDAAPSAVARREAWLSGR